MIGNICKGGCEKIKHKNTIEVKKLKMDKNGQNKNYNKIEYCLGSGLELLSAPTVLAVCQDSSVLRIR